MTTEQRVALVTGGARGIGAAIASALAAGGADVVIADLDLAGATAAATAIAKEQGVKTFAVAVDVSSTASVNEGFARAAAVIGPISILVNNAGVDIFKPFLESDEAEWDLVIGVNLKGPIRCCRAVLDGMIAAKAGRIINIGSDAGRVGSSGEAVYSGAKGGVIAFTKTLAREMAKQGITVNCVCPGPTETALLDQLASYSQRLYDGLARAIPMGRTGQPSDIAAAVAFLASDAAGYITGQTLSVSGGLTMA